MQNIRQQKSWYKYIPWMAISSLILVTVGMILWAVGTTKALTNTNIILQQFNVQADSVLNLVHEGAIGAVVVCMIMAVVMVCMALGRTSLEKKIDQQGRAVCGTWIWLATSSLLASIWWLIMFWMVFVIFGSCLWYGAAYTVEGALAGVLAVQNKIGSAMNSTSTNSTLVGNTTLVCPNTCFNLAYFSYYTTVKDACVCDVSSMNIAWSAADTAATNLHLTVAGSFIMWVGCSFMLMVSVSGFASTKRERELLMRAQRNALDAAGASMSMQGNGYAQQVKDTQPLLQQPAMQMQQAPQGIQMQAQAPALGRMVPPGMGSVSMQRV